MIHVCGIIACSSQRHRQVAPILKAGLSRLEYRGYDSVGIATLHDGLVIKKDAGKLDDVDKKLVLDSLPGTIGIAHTRWATHGPPTSTNAHPHVDCKGNIAVVHNGIIENYMELKTFLKEKKHQFKSDTDTEVIAHLMEHYSSNEKEPLAAFRQTITSLKGTYAIALLTAADPHRIYFAKQSSPLVIGIGEGTVFAASDIPAFLDQTKKIVVLRDGELGYFSATDLYIEKNGQQVKPRITTVNWSPEMAQKGGFPHFMLKEIYEQPLALENTLKISMDTLERVARMLLTSEKVIFTACGTSYHASLYGYHEFLKKIDKFVLPVISSEYSHYLHLLDEDTSVVAVSQSGETMDVLKFVKHAKRENANVIAITNVVGSSLAREATETLYMQAGPEIGVAATKTFTGQVLMMSLLSIVSQYFEGIISHDEYQKVMKHLRELPSAVSRIIRSVEPQAKSIARKIKKASSAFYLARGSNIPVAMEGALKLKEIAYIHAEAYPAGESKHGPIALVEPNFPVVFVAPRDDDERRILSNVQEMKARGGLIILVTEPNSILIDHATHSFVLPYPKSLYYRPIQNIIPLQLLSYFTATARGLDPDKPRNLAKTVTVD